MKRVIILSISLLFLFLPQTSLSVNGQAIQNPSNLVMLGNMTLQETGFGQQTLKRKIESPVRVLQYLDITDLDNKY